MKKIGLLLVVLSLITLTGCDFKKDKEPEEEQNHVDIEKSEEVNVVSFLDSNIILIGTKTVKVKLPEINSTKQNAINLNKKILEKYFERMYEIGHYSESCKIYESCSTDNYSIDYQYIIKNDIIAISVETVRDSEPSTGYGDEYLDSYFYDIKNDKELTYAEAMPELGLTFGENEKKCGYFYIENGTPKIDYTIMCSE